MTPVHPFPVRERAFDPSRKYVRVREIRPDGFILFDFAIGDPGLSVELMLRATQFDEFCRTNAVRNVDPDQARVIDQASARWSRAVSGEIDDAGLHGAGLHEAGLQDATARDAVPQDATPGDAVPQDVSRNNHERRPSR